MTSEEMIAVFDEKIAELESFFMITHNPEENYDHSMRLCEAMKLACDIVRNSSAEKQAAFRLGQMDMRMSAADALRKQAKFTKGICHSTMLADADIIESLGGDLMAIYCKGKGGICDVPCSNEACEHFDGTGAHCIPTVADRIRSMSNEQLAEAIHDLYLRISDYEFDFSELWCHPEYHGLCTGSQEDRILFCNTEERMKCILCSLNLPADEVFVS